MVKRRRWNLWSERLETAGLPGIARLRLGERPQKRCGRLRRQAAGMERSRKRDVVLHRGRKRPGQGHARDREDLADIEQPDLGLALGDRLDAAVDREQQRDLGLELVGDAK